MLGLMLDVIEWKFIQGGALLHYFSTIMQNSKWEFPPPRRLTLKLDIVAHGTPLLAHFLIQLMHPASPITHHVSQHYNFFVTDLYSTTCASSNA